MKISTEIGSAASLVGEEKAIELYAKAGFDGWDFSMFKMFRFDWNAWQMLPSDHPLGRPDYLAFARKLKRIGLDNGIVCNQSHAPFPSVWPQSRDYLLRAIECTAEAGGKICVIHPGNDKSPEENAEMYWQLLPFAKAHHVKIATENMWNWDGTRDEAAPAACSDPDSFLAHLNAVHDESFAACLDIGHAEMRGLHTSAVEMIHALGPHLQALHIHDNDRKHDDHQLPFSMEIDFSVVVQALREIGYSGYFTLEADAYLRSSGLAPEEGIGRMAMAAKRLAGMFDSV